jgi:hypothetical protein
MIVVIMAMAITAVIAKGGVIIMVCFARTKSAFEMNNIQREDVTL